MEEIVVLSGKGGTGKTTISAALATLNSDTLVADCDVDASNLYLILQPELSYQEKYISGQIARINQDLCVACGLCASHCRFEAIEEKNNQFIVNERACEGCRLCSLVCPHEALSFFPEDKSYWCKGTYRKGDIVYARLAPGEENSGRLVTVVREEAKKIAKEKKLSTIFLDGPPGIGCPVISSLTGTNKALIVTEPTKSGLHDLKRIVALCDNFKVKTYVVLNKYDLNKKLAKEIETWCESMQIELIAKLPFDEKVLQAMLACKSIIEFDEKCVISQKIKYIYQKIVKDE